MDKRSIDAALDLNFERLHWRRMRLCYMPPAFVRDIEVSPSLFARPVRRPAGYYAIDGYLGVICQPFERAYLAEHGVPEVHGRRRNPPWLAWHIANISHLAEVSFPESERQISEFCQQIAVYLEQLPHNMTDLRRALSEQRLLGQPLSIWSSANHEKLRALTMYLEASRD